MNDQLSALESMEVDRRSSSPKRKKVRQKYAPKACVSCRRSKLKCSGENPCQRCMDSGKRCFFSEDQTAAEALQNLSRPTPAPAPIPSLSNGNGIPRRSILPRDEATERRASDASAFGMSIEARMARLEAMMETLMRDRGMATTPMGSIGRDDSGSDTFHSEVAFAMPLLDPINPALAHLGQPNYSHESPSTNIESSPSIRVANRLLPLPNPIEYQDYLHSFFTDIHLRHPCIDEESFRTHSANILANDVVQTNDTQFLALNYIIFACCDVLHHVTPPASDGKPPGWHWLEIVNDLVDRESLLSGRGEVTLIQLLLYQALYYTFADIPGLAYTTIGLASRLVFQHSLHQQSSWPDNNADQTYARMCLFWNVFISDRFISSSCGRPYTIQQADVHVKSPVELFVRDIHPNQHESEFNYRHYTCLYLNYMSLWARRVANTFESIPDQNTRNEIDSQINWFLENDLPQLSLPYQELGPASSSPQKVFMIQNKANFIVCALRSVITSLQYDSSKAATISHLALSTMNRMNALRHEAKRPSSFRHQMVLSLSKALLVLCSLLVRDASDLNLQHKHKAHVEAFRNSVVMLNELAHGLPYARRVLGDFGEIIRVVYGVIEGKDLVPANIADRFPYKTLHPPLRTTHDHQTTSVGGTFHPGQSGSVEPSEFGCGVLWL